ncbi:MAG: type IV pilin protein [Planctomycetota bacterium]
MAVPLKVSFTLIELMIVVGIVAVLAAIAIPNLLEGKKSAFETQAIASLKTIGSAQETYRTNDYSFVNRTVHKTYATSFQQLGGANAHLKADGTALTLIPGPLADASDAATSYQGYFYSDIPVDDFGNAFAASDYKFGHALAAYPAVYDRTGSLTFILDVSGAVRMRDLAGQSAPDAIGQIPASNDANWTAP